MRRFARDRSGATAIEYSFILLLVAVAIVGALTALGINLSEIFRAVSKGFRLVD